MALQLELVKRDDFASDQDDLDLTGYNDGFNLAVQGWDPAIGENNIDLVTEGMTLRVRSTSDDNLAAVMQGIREKRKEAQQYKSGFDRYGVWLRAQLENETGARQALIDRLSYDLTGLYRPNRNDLESFVVALDRYPWEDTAYTNFAGANVGLIGDTFSFSNNVGDMPARLARVMFEGVNGGGGPNGRFWMGFRTSRFGTAANFQPRWDLPDSSIYDADTTGGTTNADATAAAGYVTETTFSADATLLARVTLLASDVTANPNDQRGRYIVLLRAKLSTTGTVVRARLTSGIYGGSTEFKKNNRVSMTYQTWQYYNLGTVTLPPSGLLAGSELMNNTALCIEAERVSGSANLEMDCLVLIPIGEGHVYADAGAGVVQYDSGYERPLVVHVRPNGKPEAFWYQVATAPGGAVTPQVSGGLPVGSGICVVAGDPGQYGVPSITDVIDVSIDVYQRWEYLRGAST